MDTSEIKEVILELFKKNNAISIASTGSEYSPWILQAYFAGNDTDIYLFLEKSGKTYKNLTINNNVAVSISENDATKDFLQGFGKALILPDAEEKFVRQMLLRKMPWYETYTPVAPVKLDIQKFYVSSFSRGWFPARIFEKAA